MKDEYKSPKEIAAEEFDKKADAGEDISAYLDLSTVETFEGPFGEEADKNNE